MLLNSWKNMYRITLVIDAFYIRFLRIYIIISKNIRYLLWNRGFWRLLNNTYTIYLTPCIWCTNHLCDSYGLIDVDPHFIPSLIPMIQNVDLLWRHRYKSWLPAIVTSQWLIVPAWFLWTRSYWLWLCCTISDSWYCASDELHARVWYWTN